MVRSERGRATRSDLDERAFVYRDFSCRGDELGLRGERRVGAEQVGAEAIGLGSLAFFGGGGDCLDGLRQVLVSLDAALSGLELIDDAGDLAFTILAERRGQVSRVVDQRQGLGGAAAMRDSQSKALMADAATRSLSSELLSIQRLRVWFMADLSECWGGRERRMIRGGWEYC